MSPKTGSLSSTSRQTLLQATPGIEELIRRDLTDGINTAIDAAIFERLRFLRSAHRHP